MFSALIAHYGAASFLKEGYIVYGFANPSQYIERYYWSSKKRKSKLRSVCIFICIVSFTLFCEKVLADPTLDSSHTESSASKPLESSELSDMSLEDLMKVKVSVTSGKSTDIRTAPGIVSVVTEEMIKNSGARDLIDVLKLVPGIQFGVDVAGVTSIGIRGLWGHEGKVLLLWNGHEQNELLYSTLQFGNRYPVSFIKRIEIIRGPGSALYGGNAELAVINVVTKDGADLKGGLAVASFGATRDTIARKNLELAYGNQIGDLTYDISGFFGEAIRSDRNYRDLFGNSYQMKDGNELQPLMGSVNIKYKNLDFRFMYEDYRSKQRDEYTSILEEPVSADFSTFYYDLRYNAQVSDELSLTPRVWIKNQMPWRSDLSPAEDNQEINRRVVRTTGEIVGKYEDSEVYDSIFGMQGYQDKARDYIDGGVFGNDSPYFDYTGYSLFAQGTYHHSFADLTLGGRYDGHSIFDSAFVPRFSIAKVIDNWHIKLLASSAFRNPAVENISINQALVGSGVPGFSSIKREKTQTYEIEVGNKITERDILTLNLFHTTIEDPIVFMYLQDLGAEGYLNGDQVQTIGFEFDYQRRYDWGYLQASYSYYGAANSREDIYEVPQSGGSYLGMARQKVTLAASYEHSSTFSINPSFVFFDSRYGIASLSENNEPEYEKLDPTALLNIFCQYRPVNYKNLEYGVGLYNLLGQNFKYIQPANNGHAPLPGLDPEILVRLSYRF